MLLPPFPCLSLAACFLFFFLFFFSFTNRARRIKLTYYGVNVTDSETHLPLFRGRSPIEEEAEAQSKKRPQTRKGENADAELER